uniref:Uncharacterized protein n=1 Tax=Moniliophthora roreri TaxID=221103 RepID=A0A0W0F6R3_MONRR
MGGPKLLYSLQKSFGFASKSTIRRCVAAPELQASLGIPITKEMSENMSGSLSPKFKPPPPNSKFGNIFMFDGETAERVNLQVESFEAVEAIAEVLDPSTPEESRVKLGTEATVGAMAPYLCNDCYAATPLIISPSDKSEKAEDLAAWLKEMMEQYKLHEYSAWVHGPLWAIASDGDVEVGNVDLEAEWLAGQEAALQLLHEYFGKLDVNINIQFDDIFKCENQNLCQPNGEYVGVQYTADDERSEWENEPFSMSSSTSEAEATPETGKTQAESSETNGNSCSEDDEVEDTEMMMDRFCFLDMVDTGQELA